MWQDYFQFDFELIEGYLCVFACNTCGVFMYWPPLGDRLKSSVIEQCFDYMEDQNGRQGVSRIENVDAYQLPHFSGVGYQRVLKAYDYVYYRSSLVDLRGNAYKSSRWLCNYFKSHYTYDYRPYDISMREECQRLFQIWAQERYATHTDDIYRAMLQENEQVHERILEGAYQCGLTGRVILINGEVKAYIFGEAIHPCIFCCQVEVTDLSIKGLAAFIFQQWCADEDLRPFVFINAMDDAGSESLKQTKQHYRPVIYHESYTVTRT